MARASAIDELGVKDLVHRLFELHRPYAEIIGEIERATGQRVSDSALSRERDKWSAAQARLKDAEAQAKVITDVLAAQPGVNFKDAALGLLWSKLLKRMAEAEASFDGADMLELGHLVVKAIRADQTGDALDLQKQRLDLLKQKVAATAENVESIGRAKGLDEATLKKIREDIYGLAA
jgi:hypothetical protein